MQLLGKVSYSFYLWHLSVNFYGIYFMKKYLKVDEQTFFSDLNHYILFGIIMITFSLVISFFTFKFVEDFFLRKSHIQKSMTEVGK